MARYTDRLTLDNDHVRVVNNEVNQNRALANLKAKGVKLGDGTITVPKVTLLGIRGWGFVDFLVKSSGMKLVRS